MAEIGVLKAMTRYGLEPDLIVGTSGGAIVAALAASGWTPDQMIALLNQWAKRPGQLLDFNWSGLFGALLRLNLGPFAGLLRGDRLREIFGRVLKEADDFRLLTKGTARKPLYLTAVDLEDGTPMVFCNPQNVRTQRDPETGEYEGYRVCGHLPVSLALRASISIPGVFVPAGCRGDCPDSLLCHGGVTGARDRFVDGGVRENLPLAVAVRLARAGLVLGVNLGYAGLRRDGVARRGIGEVVSQSLDIMGLDQFEETLRDELVAQARVVVLNPMIYDVGTFELEFLPQLIARGERLAEEFFRERGLIPGGAPKENRQRLFPRNPGALLYPSRGSDAYFDWLEQIKDEGGGPGPRAQRLLKRHRVPLRQTSLRPEEATNETGQRRSLR